MGSGQLTGAGFDANYALDDKYVLESGRIFLNGVQALVRLPLMQRQRDLAAGLNTAGFISGYRGSPLGGYDFALWQAKSTLETHHIHFEPGVNEDLAATSVWGSQQSQLIDGPRYDGVFGIWYGKGPGVDRSCDALKHANYAGSSPAGGVLVLAGDDPGAKSSSIAHQSEYALVHCGIPILNPSNIQDYLDFGLFGWAMSRYSGCWVGFKCLTDTVESSASVVVDPDRVVVVHPDDFELPPLGLNISFSNYPIAVESRLFEQRHLAAQAFVRANGLDRVALDSPNRRLGIVTTGKTYLDVRQALEELGVDDTRAATLGLSIYKVAMPWPLEPVGARAFASGLDEVIVVEEKRPLMEEQLALLLYNLDSRPRLVGKRDEQGTALVPNVGELSPQSVLGVLRVWLERCSPGFAAPHTPDAMVEAGAGASNLTRIPSFCSGCPHNTSTVIPDGSIAMGGIGCHGMAAFMPERRTLAVTQMGGEGATWIGQSRFTDTPHIFQNLGDGTYFHSGLLAIRAAVTANVSITYKILVNGAVAMTGGQPIEGEPMEGEITTPEIVRQLDAEGVATIAVLSDDIAKYPRGSFPSGVTVHHRDKLDRVQRQLRGVSGVSAIVYDQTCAAEARRLRKRGEFPDPDRRIVINEAVCEGCGDCSVQSNCIAIEPIETEFGRKRKINQSSCNKDFSCIKGLCPSFVSVIGGSVRKHRGDAVAGYEELFAALPEPRVADTNQPFNVFVAGIGGTGVITVGALIGMAAHLEGKGCSILDVTGLAQKNGAVSSHVRIAARPDDLHATRISNGAADLLLGCDIVVAAGADGVSKLRAGRTTVIVNSHVAPTSDFATNADLDLSSAAMEDCMRATTSDDDFYVIDSTRLATALMGDAIASNLFLVGFALQKGRLPVGIGALERAIELNGREVAMNKRALAWGRLAAHDFDAVEAAARPNQRESQTQQSTHGLDELVANRVAFLTRYQSARFAGEYAGFVDRVARAENRVSGDGSRLAEAVARYLSKLLAYKDEYEVARLYASDDFQRQLRAEFEGDYKLQFHLSPPLFTPRDRDTGRFIKLTFGPWFMKAFELLAKLKFLRATPLDIFGYTRHRRLQVRMIRDYRATVEELLDGLTAGNLDQAVEIASIPEHIRGYDIVLERHHEDALSKQSELLDAFRRVAGPESSSA
ncbi:MAG: indolepyruvate ferredoxin oxidoreductase family protein [Myxococcota bacterium]